MYKLLLKQAPCQSSKFPHIGRRPLPVIGGWPLIRGDQYRVSRSGSCPLWQASCQNEQRACPSSLTASNASSSRRGGAGGTWTPVLRARDYKAQGSRAGVTAGVCTVPVGLSCGTDTPDGCLDRCVLFTASAASRRGQDASTLASW